MREKKRTSAAAFLAAAFFLILSSAASLRAEELSVPRFQDPQALLLRPDLPGLPRLRFLATTDFPPFSSLDAQGQLAGFNVDLARAVCAELALTVPCDIQAIPWAELPQALARGDGDAILAGVAVSGPSRRSYAFSEPYLRFPGRFAVLQSDKAGEPLAKTLKNSLVGVVAASAHERFLRERFSGLALKTYPGIPDMVRDLAAGRIRAAFGDGLRLSFWLNSTDGACCRFVGGPYWSPSYFGSGLTIAVRPDDRRLLDALDYALAEIAAKNRFTELTLRWFPVSFF